MYYDNRTRLNIVRSWNIQPGDFVNLVSWFEDVWAEVKKVVERGLWYIGMMESTKPIWWILAMFGNCAEKKISTRLLLVE